VIGRAAALGALAVVVLATAAFVLLGGDEEYELRIRFQNASQLVGGNEVMVGGVPVGIVDEIELSDNGEAEVSVRITDEDLTPLHEGTRAEVRIPSLSSVAARYIQLHPGPNSNDEIPSGATIATARTASVVEIDSLLSTLDTQTREATQDLLRNQRAIYEGRSAAANRGLVALNPALTQLGFLVRDVGRDSDALEQFLVRSASVVSAVASRDSDLEAALTGAATTAREISDERVALTGVLRKAPATLTEAAGTLRELDRTFVALRPAARELRPVAPKAAALVRELQPLLRRSGPAIDTVRGLLPDLRVVLDRLPVLRDAAIPSFDATVKALADSDPIVQGTRPFLPDLYYGVVTGFGGTQANSYDANGHYARIAPIASQLSLTGALSGLGDAIGNGISLPFQGGNNLRCSGGGYRQVTDSPNNTPTGDIPCRPEDAP
jgi:phospholipid/cholesterol/gamma-HCH transport system substrate-binding protein